MPLGVVSMTRALIAAAACCVALVAASPASAASFDPASPEFGNALNVAQQHWGSLPCGGQVAYRWIDEDPAVNATAYWSPGFTNCEIVFNRNAGMDWAKFCTILTHELGHLHGRGHSDDPSDLMSAYYSGPIAACGGGSAPASAASDDAYEEEAPIDPEALQGVRMTKRQLARLRRARMCNRKQTRRAIRRCKRTMARRAARRKHLARSVTVIAPATLPAAPVPAQH